MVIKSTAGTPLSKTTRRWVAVLSLGLLSSCATDVTKEYESEWLQRGAEYSLKEAAFLRDYKTILSIHPPMTPYWAPISIDELSHEKRARYLIKDVLPKGTRIKFTGVKMRRGYDHPVTRFYGEITSGDYSGEKEIIIDDLITKNGSPSPEVAKQYLEPIKPLPSSR